MANEKRLIDATPLIDDCDECRSIEWNKSVYTTWAEAEEDFMQRLLDAPTVDAVEVVRCKDCKRRYFNEYIEEYCCEQWGDGFDTVCTDDDFCSRGERKDNG